MCLECKPTRVPESPSPLWDGGIPKPIAKCILKRFPYDRASQLYDDYIQKKSDIWERHDISMEVLDVEAKRVADLLAKNRKRLENSWFDSWEDISYRRRRRRSRSSRLSGKWSSLLDDLDELGSEPHTCLENHNRRRVKEICRNAIQSLNDKFIALLEAERLKEEELYQSCEKLSFEHDKKVEAGCAD